MLPITSVTIPAFMVNRLDLHKNLIRDDDFVAVFHVVPRDNAVIHGPLFLKEVDGLGLLQYGIDDVFF